MYDNKMVGTRSTGCGQGLQLCPLQERVKLLVKAGDAARDVPRPFDLAFAVASRKQPILDTPFQIIDHQKRRCPDIVL